MRQELISAALSTILGLVLACPVRAADQANSAGQSGPAASAGAAKSDDETADLGGRLADAVRRQDAAAAEKLLDVDALFERIAAGVSVPADFKRAYGQGFRPIAILFMDNIVKAPGGDAADGYYLLRVRQVNDETRVLFRSLPAGGSLNYHDWVVGKDRQGQLKFQDAYVAISGEMLSQSLHRIYVQNALAVNPGLPDRLSGKDKEYASNFSKLLQITKDFQGKAYRQVLADYKALPESMRKDKNCMLIRLQSAEALLGQSPEEHKVAMEDYRQTFPGDPSVDLVCYDGLIMAKQFAEARRSLDRLDAFTGGDPFLHFLRGNTYKLEGGDDNLAKARELYKKAIDEEPTLLDPYWALVMLSLDTRQYDDTAFWLTRIQQKRHTKIKDLTTLPKFAGFVKSPAYQKWVAGQEAPKAEGKDERKDDASAGARQPEK